MATERNRNADTGRTEVKRAAKDAVARHSSLPLYLTLMGSVFASAALGLLLQHESKAAKWTYFAVGLGAIIVGCIWEFARKHGSGQE